MEYALQECEMLAMLGCRDETEAYYSCREIWDILRRVAGKDDSREVFQRLFDDPDFFNEEYYGES